MSKRRWAFFGLLLAVVGLGASSAAAAVTAVTANEVTASGTPRVVIKRGPAGTSLPLSSPDQQWSPVPGAQLTISIATTKAPALVRLHWSGQWACSDVGQLRFVVD